MKASFQFVPGGMRISRFVRRELAVILLLGIAAICPLMARAQDAPQGAIGRVEGKDISVESGAAAGNGTSTAAPSIYVSNGSIVTVHSGQGQLTLFGGGEVEICGPAKFTVLLSADAITLALNFGRLRVQLPEKTTLRIFTPTIIGTPLGLSGAARDVTVGLNLDDSLCVVASSGAIQLEHQFTGEKLIVPQAGEFFLSGGRLLPVAGTPGSCQCAQPEQRVIPAPAGPPPEFAAVTAPAAGPEIASAAPKPAATLDVAPDTAPATAPRVEFSIPANANEDHPVTPQTKNVAAGPPPSEPVYTVVLPPLMFSAGSPARPATEAPNMVLLIREAQVSPEWEFSGHVQAPEFAVEMQRALGERAGTNQEPANQPGQEPRGKGGFWEFVKRAFGGGG